MRLRDREPGDLGWLVQRHAEIYAQEFGWQDDRFERMVARIAADFDPARDRLWVAEVDGERMGAVMCAHQDERVAKLRTLIVEPKSRGLGVGGALVDAVIEHAKAHGYETLTLWTNDGLRDARRLYEQRGFALIHEAPHAAFEEGLVEQTWSLTLKP